MKAHDEGSTGRRRAALGSSAPVVELDRLDPPPAGFAACTACAYQKTGTPAICFACANAEAAVPDAARGCPVCGQELADDGLCANAVCNFDDRVFFKIHTVSGRADEMWKAVSRFKYDEDRGWAEILGRILVGYLEEHRVEFEGYDFITPGGIYVGPRAKRLWDHLRLILDAAQIEGPTWPFAYDLIVKTGPTDQFLGKSPRERSEIAEGRLRSALSVPDPDRVAGKRILVFDDVYSEGFSMREMARALVHAGAAEVSGIVLARRKGC